MGVHDDLFHYVLGHERYAADLLRVALPPKFAARLQWRTLKGRPTVLVDLGLRGSHNDFIFSVRMRGRSQPIFLLLEHQTRVDRRMAARIRRYVARLQEWWRRQHPHSRKEPLLVTVVLYHGRDLWTASCRLEELLDIPLEAAEEEQWLEYLLRLSYRLYDLMQRSEEELQALPCAPLVRLALVLARRASLKTLGEGLLDLVDLFREVLRGPSGEEELAAVLNYLRRVNRKGTYAAIQELLHSLVPGKNVEETMRMMRLGLSAKERRTIRQEALAEGEAKGEAKGQAKAVLRLLRARGMRVDARSRQRILRCTDPAQLDLWLDRAAHAKKLADVLDQAS
jgi:predicted transposase YdaD